MQRKRAQPGVEGERRREQYFVMLQGLPAGNIPARCNDSAEQSFFRLPAVVAAPSTRCSVVAPSAGAIAIITKNRDSLFCLSLVFFVLHF